MPRLDRLRACELRAYTSAAIRHLQKLQGTDPDSVKCGRFGQAVHDRCAQAIDGHLLRYNQINPGSIQPPELCEQSGGRLAEIARSAKHFDSRVMAFG